MEIIHNIFNYLSAHEILLSFSNINHYFDAILSTYPYYRFEFKSILRSHFDLVCSRIAPNQVISLTLSDLEDTPGQSELFFSRFQITDFSRLRLLKLIDIESASWEDVYPYSKKLNNHHRLFIESTHTDRLPRAQLLFHANQIRINNISQLPTNILPNLRDLTVSESSIFQLKRICASANRLKSLKINRLILNTTDELLLPAQQLTRLVLYLNGKHLDIYNT